MYKPLIVFFLLNFSLSWSQKDFVTSGGDGKSDQGSFSYSIGQILVMQMDTPGSSWSQPISLNHGVQQVFVSACEINQNITILATPNPTTGLVNVDIPNWNDVQLNISVFDVLGKYILNKTINQRKTQLDLSRLSSGMYILTISDTCGGSNSFKLILNNK